MKNTDTITVSPVFRKSRPNHLAYLRILREMTPEQRFLKAMELSFLCKHLFFEGLKKRFPDKSPEEIHTLYLKRIKRCYNQHY